MGEIVRLRFTVAIFVGVVMPMLLSIWPEQEYLYEAPFDSLLHTALCSLFKQALNYNVEFKTIFLSQLI